MEAEGRVFALNKGRAGPGGVIAGDCVWGGARSWPLSVGASAGNLTNGEAFSGAVGAFDMRWTLERHYQ